MENFELNEMREQINMLKSKLNNQTIINDKLIRETISNKFDYLRKSEIVAYILVLFVVFFGSWVFYYMNLSWWFIGATALYMLAFGIGAYSSYRKLNEANVFNEDMLSTAKKINELKNSMIKWRRRGLSTIFLWLGWLIYEMAKETDDLSMLPAIILPPLFGGLIGGLIGTLWHKRIIGSCDDIIAQIEK